MNNLAKYIVSFVAISSLLCACNIYRYVPENDHLYKGGTLVINNKSERKKYDDLKKKLTKLLRPASNTKAFGIPFSLSFYSISKPPTGKGINYLLHNLLGQSPVLLSQVNEPALKERLLNKLHNEGYMQAVVIDSSYRTAQEDANYKNKRDAHSRFIINTGIQYVIDSVSYALDTALLWKGVKNSSGNTLLKKGEAFTLDLAIAERARIDTFLRNKGFFYFSPELLLLRADTSRPGFVNVNVMEKPAIAPESKRRYTIGKVNIFSDYNARNSSPLSEKYGSKQNGFLLIDPEKKFRPKVFSENVLLQEGKIYSLDDHEKTLKRLINLNEFKFINAFFKPSDSTENAALDVNLLLTPYPRQSLQLELGSYSKSNNFIGSELKLKVLDRNLFHGAERLEFNLSAGFEKQVGGSDILGNNNSNQSASLDFYAPRLWLPFKPTFEKNNFISKTRTSLGIEFTHKQELYTLRSTSFKFGYIWKKKQNTESLFNPLAINLVQPIYISPSYQETLNKDPNLAKSFEKQFIIGSEYSFRFNNQTYGHKLLLFSNNLSVDLSGNLLGLVVSKSGDSTGEKKIFNTPFSQFILISNDLRGYIQKEQSRLSWVNRLFLGYGYAYGNNQAMPLIKQFFVGGSSSLRAFRNGLLGPGTYKDTTQQEQQAIQSGDIKMEFSTEARYKIGKYFSLAAFIDAGNVWLRKEAVDRPGSGFSGNWFKELAVGTGVGFRIDASVIVVRFDWAIPLRKPWLPSGDRWVINKIDLGNPVWRKENLILNIAIGYPF